MSIKYFFKLITTHTQYISLQGYLQSNQEIKNQLTLIEEKKTNNQYGSPKELSDDFNNIFQTVRDKNPKDSFLAKSASRLQGELEINLEKALNFREPKANKNQQNDDSEDEQEQEQQQEHENEDEGEYENEESEGEEQLQDEDKDEENEEEEDEDEDEQEQERSYHYKEKEKRKEKYKKKKEKKHKHGSLRSKQKKKKKSRSKSKSKRERERERERGRERERERERKRPKSKRRETHSKSKKYKKHGKHSKKPKIKRKRIESQNPRINLIVPIIDKNYKSYRDYSNSDESGGEKYVKRKKKNHHSSSHYSYSDSNSENEKYRSNVGKLAKKGTLLLKDLLRDRSKDKYGNQKKRTTRGEYRSMINKGKVTRKSLKLKFFSKELFSDEEINKIKKKVSSLEEIGNESDELYIDQSELKKKSIRKKKLVLLQPTEKYFQNITENGGNIYKDIFPQFIAQKKIKFNNFSSSSWQSIPKTQIKNRKEMKINPNREYLFLAHNEVENIAFNLFDTLNCIDFVKKKVKLNKNPHNNNHNNNNNGTGSDNNGDGDKDNSIQIIENYNQSNTQNSLKSFINPFSFGNFPFFLPFNHDPLQTNQQKKKINKKPNKKKSDRSTNKNNIPNIRKRTFVNHSFSNNNNSQNAIRNSKYDENDRKEIVKQISQLDPQNLEKIFEIFIARYPDLSNETGCEIDIRKLSDELLEQIIMIFQELQENTDELI
ncbi:brakeless protein [Anaeramoeba flamelloides]|uniref:Brakeless protein n=1 Tax=Anaeramoeba flamelloides TaxID=1746091 RepID=A0AAV8A5M5_9EUKA|nr:brakeless protein [Anaeramoeba flamelloides]